MTRFRFVALVLLVLAAIPRAASADALPGDEVCSEPAWLECAHGARATDDIDACTRKELARLGLRFHCGASHNDRLEGYWCRRPRLPRRPKDPAPGATGPQADAQLDKVIAWEALRAKELGPIEAELYFDTYTDRYFRDMSARRGAAPRRDPMRLDCFALYEKYKRCALETARCTPYWDAFRTLAHTEFSRDLPTRDTFAAAAIEAVEGRGADEPSDPGDAAARADAAAPNDAGEANDAASRAAASELPRPPSRSCLCDAGVGLAHGGTGALVVASCSFVVAVARRRARR